MNTANLQMEGTLLALAALCEALKQKGMLSPAELENALDCAERGVSARAAALSVSNVEAIRFPIRFLRVALQRDGQPLDYSSIAAHIGRARDEGSFEQSVTDPVA